MRHRATYQDIIAFTWGNISESAIMAERWPPGSYSQLQNLGLKEGELGLLLFMGWPEFRKMSRAALHAPAASSVTTTATPISA